MEAEIMFLLCIGMKLLVIGIILSAIKVIANEIDRNE